MNREIKTTRDGSKTLYIRELNESYHSHNGAIREAKHVFIYNGLKIKNNYEINILELGFGSGLNVLVTIDEFLRTDKNHIINYFTVEKFPVSTAELHDLNYSAFFPELKQTYFLLHESNWNQRAEILPNFFFTKFHNDFFDLPKIALPKIDLVYYDCFGARVQPDLWDTPLLKIVADKMEIGGLLTTYASKGSFRRCLEQLGFDVQKKPGPPGKREMTTAVKLAPTNLNKNHIS